MNIKPNKNKPFSLSDIKDLVTKELPKNLKDTEAKGRGILSSLPLGGLIDKLLFHNKDKKEVKQLAIYILDIENELSKLDQSKLDKDFLKTEEFYCLFKKILEKIRFESKTNRIKYFRNFLLNSMKRDKQKINFNYYLDKIDVLEIEHLQIMEWYINKKYDLPNRIGSKFDSDRSNELPNISDFMMI